MVAGRRTHDDGEPGQGGGVTAPGRGRRRTLALVAVWTAPSLVFLAFTWWIYGTWRIPVPPRLSAEARTAVPSATSTDGGGVAIGVAGGSVPPPVDGITRDGGGVPRTVFFSVSPTLARSYHAGRGRSHPAIFGRPAAGRPYG